ncbi:hypothetical protein [Kitasatospora sp. NPDC051914]|uniref:hypothetical protein n=1 Tax=Kitasatospora sp. NPDC051914 TaxID=3154945 RepID=UPI00341B6834
MPTPPGTAAGTPEVTGRRSPDSPRTATTAGRSAATARVHGSHPASASDSRAPRTVAGAAYGMPTKATAHAALTPRTTRVSTSNVMPDTVPRGFGARCPFPASAATITVWTAPTGGSS